jgi:L,D-peptidoglycan transpeptidase YkuD (ErfK/YbiS/YcfS/YnhG family)
MRRWDLSELVSRSAWPVAVAGALVLAQTIVPAGWAQAGEGSDGRRGAVGSASPLAAAPSPEQRLIAVYRLIGEARLGEALEQVDALVRDVPNFRLAHLVRGDLLTARRGALGGFAGGVTQTMPDASDVAQQIEQMRQEADLRLRALQDMPPPGAVPRQFVMLPASTAHAIAVDASRSRLYLFEHRSGRLALTESHYVSIGRAGVDKRVEGDQRTPLGVYFITSKLSDKQLKDFYGAGALPLNYPNEYDRRIGRTGSGIWLHGVPSESYARAPRETDGCVVLANDDLRRIMGIVRARQTPVVIAERIDWVAPDSLDGERRRVLALLEGWRGARWDPSRAADFYAASLGDDDKAQPSRVSPERLFKTSRPRPTQLKEVSILAWYDHRDLLVVTFGEVPQGARSGAVLRQYWAHDGNGWKIVYEGVVG